MRISLIVAIYKDLTSLKLIVESLQQQDYINFELIVAEDNSSVEIKQYLNTVTGIDIIHTTQEDSGVRKARSQNNAIIRSTGDYLIFIDGDCIPYTTFISSHAELAEKNRILIGRRVNLGCRISSAMRNKSIKPSTIEKYFVFSSFMLILDGATHLGQGLFFKPNGYLYKHIILKRKKSNLELLGCNFSCFKRDILAINGFDESYGETPLADDTDIQWRFDAYGLKPKSCKMTANIFHLYHTAKSYTISDDRAASMTKKMRERKIFRKYQASTGLSSHSNYTPT